MTTTKKSFIIHIDSLDVLDELSNEQAGQILKAMRDFENGKEPELSGILKAVWIPFQNQLKRDGDKYNNICSRNKENIKKRWNKDTTKNTTGKTGNTPNPHSKNKNKNKNKNDSKNKKRSFAPPTLEEVKSYFKEKGSFDNEAVKMFNYYEAGEWKLANGKKMKNWKQSAAGWIGRSEKFGGAEDQIQRDFDNRKSDRHFQNKYSLEILKKYLFASV